MRTAKWPARYKPMLALSSPQMLCTLVVSIASLRVSGGKIVGIRFAIIDFPDPGGPMQRMLGPMYLQRHSRIVRGLPTEDRSSITERPEKARRLYQPPRA